MAVSVIGIGASLLSSAVTSAAVTAGYGVATSYIAGGLVGTIVAGGLSGLVSKNEQDNTSQIAEQQASALVNKSSNNAPLPVIYGLRKLVEQESLLKQVAMIMSSFMLLLLCQKAKLTHLRMFI